MDQRPLRHFSFLTEEEEEHIFARLPQPVTSSSPPKLRGLALGATLYSPGTRPHLEEDAMRAARIGVTSHVWCLEDSIAHEDVPMAMTQVVDALGRLLEVQGDNDLPMVFVRVRSVEQMTELGERAGANLRGLMGFVVPKAHSSNFMVFMSAIKAINRKYGLDLFLMPVLETPELAWVESRRDELVALRNLFNTDPNLILSVRVGATDLCGLFGLRRDRETVIWDVAPVRDALSDALNVFARRGDFIVSGPVWEHFSGPSRLLSTSLRHTPFFNNDSLALRQNLMAEDSDELVREVLLDRANGFSGKTVIHPTHVSIVNALMAVTLEEYDDATAIAENAERGGVGRSSSTNKMNEFGPHALWAKFTLARAEVYGVMRHRYRVLDLIDAGRRAAEENYPSASSVATVSQAGE